MSAAKLPDAGFIYTGPMYWPGKEPWQPAPGKCRGQCSKSEGNHTDFWQCPRPIKVEREVLHHGEPVTMGYCGQHDPVKVAERHAKRDAQYRAKWAAREARWNAEARKEEMGEAAVDALRQIAAGHNDARGLAQEVLARFPEPEEPVDAEA